MDLTNTNAQAVVHKLTCFNFPMLRLPIQAYEIDCMEQQLDSIEESMTRFRNHLKFLKHQIDANES